MGGSQQTPRILGLTGGIASGKSTVAQILTDLGAEVVDADQLARDIVQPGQPALGDIVRTFGAEMLAADGQLDRKRLAARIFGDPDARRTLNAITHPRIGELAREKLAEAAARGQGVVVYMAPLLVENGLHFLCDRVAVISLAEEVQVERLRAREGLDEAAARARLAAQLPLAAKLAVADYVIDNGASLEITRAQTEAMWQNFLLRPPRSADGNAAQ